MSQVFIYAGYVSTTDLFTHVYCPRQHRREEVKKMPLLVNRKVGAKQWSKETAHGCGGCTNTMYIIIIIIITLYS